MTAPREPHWSDEHATIYNGDAREVLAELGESITRSARAGGNEPNSITTAWPPPGKYGTAGEDSAGVRHGAAMRPTGERHSAAHPNGKNPGDVWPISTRPLRAAHFAAFPIDIPRKAIAAGCRPGGTVLDPFAGSGTTGIAARQLDRKFPGIELNEPFIRLAVARIREAGAASGGIA
ncbi:site-specific DNA-methyltransferase [Microtetraspora sp. NBRC 16547]|uniref:DNA-methyltransferase n=1 Tax=Microtetraspora sp. NBRC 16547 TaxID=3030993 RepID=UPI0025536E7B|nr:site-specific DNA-methyltransferase [Microtetraspora sp. NBRC 16547]